MNDQRTLVVVALWAGACLWFMAVTIGDDPFSIPLFVLLALATIVFAAVARRAIVVPAPLVLSIPLGLWAATAACPCDGTPAWEVVLVWFAVYGIGGSLLAAITLVFARRRHPGSHHPPFRLDRPV